MNIHSVLRVYALVVQPTPGMLQCPLMTSRHLRCWRGDEAIDCDLQTRPELVVAAGWCILRVQQANSFANSKYRYFQVEHKIR